MERLVVDHGVRHSLNRTAADTGTVGIPHRRARVLAHAQAAAAIGLTREALARSERSWLSRRWKLPILAVWTAAWFVILAPGGGIAWNFFLHGSSLLFTGHLATPGPAGGLHLYANYPQLQIGPLAFASAAVLRHLGPHDGLVTAELIMTAMGLVIVYAAERIALTVRPDLARSPALQRTLLAGGALFMIAWVELTVAYGHLDDALALLCAVTALWAAVTNRPGRTGLLVGLAIDAKPWALIFLPLLLLSGGRAVTQSGVAAQTRAHVRAWAQVRAWGRVPPWALAAACALAVTAAGWLPFFVADPATMTAVHYTIRNMPDSALRAIGFTTARTPPWDRAAQIIVAWVLGALALWRRRGAAVILLAAGARIALDPGTHGYYTAAVMAGALLWDTLGARRPFPLWSVLSFCALNLVPLLTANAVVRGTIRLDLVIAFTLAVLLGPARWYWQPAPRSESASPAAAHRRGEHPRDHVREVQRQVR